MSSFTESELARAEGVLNLAMMNLGGEPPATVYTREGLGIWLRAVVYQIAGALTEDWPSEWAIKVEAERDAAIEGEST